MTRGDADSNLSYDFSDKYGHTVASISSHSLKCLETSRYLNDEVIQFYTAYLTNDLCPGDLVKKIHVFDNLFHKLLTDIFAETKPDKDPPLFEKVMPKWRSLSKWFNGVDIFERDFLVFPVCKDDHWFVIIVCYPSEVRDWDHVESPPGNSDTRNRPIPGIIVLDSLGIKASMVTKHVREFLDYEWRTRATVIKSFHWHNLEEYYPKLPKQTNAFDCGIFTLAYLRAFILNSDKFYRTVRRSKSETSETLNDLVNESLTACSRESIRNLITKRCEVKRIPARDD